MNKIVLLLASLFASLFCCGQNVGVGTITPTEKLDVNGNINLNGQLKINGDSGTARQVLMKDAGNNLVWGDLSDYKNMIVFDCSGIAFSVGSGNCSGSWTVPAGVTNILVECWGGGGGGCLTGGGGGGYISAKLVVIPLTSPGITIGAGGNFGGVGVNGIIGGTSSFTIGGITLSGTGGLGGSFTDPLTGGAGGQSSGGGFSVSGLTSQYIGYFGSPGGISRLNFVQTSSTEFEKAVYYGDGGDAGLLPGSGAKGGYKLVGATVTQTIYATAYGIQQGGGGGADPSYGFYGRGGRIIIHW